ncbi:MAG TPA: hypothetical protein VFA28_06735 [Bryobacteraceae bacterium]|jgi:hypothetical protein|nr:hypothetical protein [Bryobacteraceae bacterium]
MRYFCAVILCLAPACAAERMGASAPKCGQERSVKRGFWEKALGLPGAFEKHFSDLALSASSVGIPQARCQATPPPASDDNLAIQVAAHDEVVRPELVEAPAKLDRRK